jgi:hypothetical protein
MSAAKRLSLTEVYRQHYPTWNPDAKPTSLRRHLYDLRRWKRLMGDIPVADVHTESFQEFRRRSADKGDRPRTTETTLSTIRMVLRLAKVHRIIPDIPDRGRSRRIPPPSPEVPGMDALLRLYEAADTKGLLTWPRSNVPPSVWWQVLLVAAVWTGFRRSDLFWKFSWDHIDEFEDCIKFAATKERERPHAVPLCDVVLRHLRALEPVGPYRLVFGCSQSIDLIRRELRLLRARAGLSEDITPQTLRRMAVNLWADADEMAGQIIQGSGLSKGSYSHYRDQLRVLTPAAEKIAWPDRVSQFGVREGERQLTLF